MAKIGTLSHVKGFTLNKLFEKHCFTGSGRTHGKHMTAKNLPAGYPPQYHNYSATRSENCELKG
jgi:hypothetical protein